MNSVYVRLNLNHQNVERGVEKRITNIVKIFKYTIAEPVVLRQNKGMQQIFLPA